ncbi:hypothetical protein ACH4D5_36960 [Streptomyces sp. NPDC018029]
MFRYAFLAATPAVAGAAKAAVLTHAVFEAFAAFDAPAAFDGARS